MKKKVHVKPIVKNDNGKWGVFVHNDLEAFVDDTRRYGLKTAIYNLYTSTFVL
jgi:hypothetical protein